MTSFCHVMLWQSCDNSQGLLKVFELCTLNKWKFLEFVEGRSLGSRHR